MIVIYVGKGETPIDTYSDVLQQLLEAVLYQTEVMIVLGNLLFGFFIGYVCVKAITCVWQ